MASDPVARAIIALPRRVASGRLAQRLLVVAGILAAGWLLGGAAQAAHADTTPVADAVGVAADTPVVGDALRAVDPGGALRAARGGAERAAHDVTAGAAQRQPVASLPPVRDEAGRPAADVPARHAAPRAERPEVPKRVHSPAQRRTAHQRRAVTHRRSAHGRPAHRVAHRAVDRAASMAGIPRPGLDPIGADASSSHQAEAPLAPVPAPAQAGPALPAPGLIMLGGLAGAVTRRPPALARPSGVLLRVFGALPPAVRTAADEPSFAPD
ncbi:hypothetical protein [Actinomadura parmotrematis]|uniref:Uncharacterized protein n=1 Tax=Actinomadura parmotrematis TaxID=2864039 RepID=A0ABS7G3I2_9ACTN|nr:hypothetical protein [Actinomadura parmotrematis]MBW8487279.1 hypothetical protein [Actinomadura parmotrematis]